MIALQSRGTDALKAQNGKVCKIYYPQGVVMPRNLYYSLTRDKVILTFEIKHFILTLHNR
jgi:hypothetical protein